MEDFVYTFSFEFDDFLVDYALQWMKDIIFQKTRDNVTHELYLCEYHRAHTHTRELVECYNIKEDEIEEEDDPRNIELQELEG